MAIWSDFAASVPTVNLMHGARRWIDQNPTAQVDAQGYLLSLPNGNAVATPVIINDQGRDECIPKGEYIFTWEGQGTFDKAFSSATYTQISNTSSGGRAIVNYQGGGFWLQCTAIPNSSNRPRNFKLLMPGTEANYNTNPWYEPYVKRLRWVNTIRLMDYFSTNGNTVSNWSDRVTPDHFTQQDSKGGCIEYACSLANKLYLEGSLRKVWLNVPAAANDTYVTNMAQMFLDLLNPNLKVIVEHTNEVWNYSGAFPQTYLDSLGRTLITVPESDSWMYRLVGHAHRCLEVFHLWKQIWSGANASRVETVVNIQTNNSGISDIILNYVHPTRGKVGNYVDAFAIAPYFDGGASDLFNSSTFQFDYTKLQNQLNKSNTQWLADLRTDAIQGCTNKINIEKNYIAQNFPGKKLKIYEWQQHVTPDLVPSDRDKFGNTVGSYEQSGRFEYATKFRAINRDPEMGNIIYDALMNIQSLIPGEDICCFSYISPDPSAPPQALTFGYWGFQEGMLRSITSQDTVKLNAAIRAWGKTPSNYA